MKVHSIMAVLYYFYKLPLISEFYNYKLTYFEASVSTDHTRVIIHKGKISVFFMKWIGL